uniref:Uncharacterized protein n=1 Tax=Romanomermis culicivorax TaxID=13658 RepID=A0A915JC89_ROMCU
MSSVTRTIKMKKNDRKIQNQENTEKEMSSRLVIMNMMSAHTLFLGERRIMSNLAVQYMTNAINEAMDQ